MCEPQTTQQIISPPKIARSRHVVKTPAKFQKSPPQYATRIQVPQSTLALQTMQKTQLSQTGKAASPVLPIKLKMNSKDRIFGKKAGSPRNPTYEDLKPWTKMTSAQKSAIRHYKQYETMYNIDDLSRDGTHRTAKTLTGSPYEVWVNKKGSPVATMKTEARQQGLSPKLKKASKRQLEKSIHVHGNTGTEARGCFNFDTLLVIGHSDRWFRNRSALWIAVASLLLSFSAALILAVIIVLYYNDVMHF